MKKLTADKYRELFRLRAEGKLDHMECTKSLYRLLKPLYFKGIKILDVPCGVGHFFRKLRELGEIEYLGIDIDPESIRIAKEIWKNAPNAKFQVGDITRLNLSDNSMDIVYCYNLMLHLETYEAALKELFRVSKRYLFVRSLFGEKTQIRKVEVCDDYWDVYKSGFVYYNTYAREDIIRFLRGLGPCKIRFIDDNVVIPESSIKKQAQVLGVNESEFTKGGGDKKQTLKGMRLNYEVLSVEKITRTI
ncbi:MAG: class I SAM-dependent methyltransferase [Candidatus Anstonellales archaeon]